MPTELTDERRVFLSTLPAGPRQRRLALAVVLVSVAIFLAAAPFAKTPLAQVPAFIPTYESALAICDLITAVLLFGQFTFLRSRALFVLASGYLFTACITVAHALTFPGLFSPTGLLGAGPQTTAWMYTFWHGGFPLVVIGYALLKHEGPEATGTSGPPRGNSRAAILAGIAAVLAIVCGFTLFATAGHEFLPAIMQGSHISALGHNVLSSAWVVSLVSLIVLWWRRPHTVLDLWLMVVMCAWLFDIALSVVLAAGRYDLGFYAGRIYGLMAASFVLIVLLLENSALYAKLAEAHEKHAKRLMILHEIDRAIVAQESSQAIAGAVIQPLRELLGVSRAIVNMFDLATGEVEWLAAAGRHRTHVGPGVRYSMELMGDVESLKRGSPQIINTHALSPGPDKDALLASGVEQYMAVPMIAGGELLGAISFGGESGPFPAAQVEIATEVATQLAIAIAQARLYARVKLHAEELEQRVRERTSELVGVNKDLYAFSYSVAHDLRAPLRAVDGYAAMLEETYAVRLDAEGNRLLGEVRASTQRMGRLIDALLELARLGREPLRTQRVELNDLVNQAVDELRAGCGRSSIDFVVGKLGTAVADPALLKQVLANLLGNAVKFTRNKNHAVVEVGCRTEAEKKDENIYYVKDNGAGFDMRYADKLFGVFQRLHRADEYEGTGIGLSIVRHIVNRHGGRVWADSKLGEGATFYFTLQSA
jgi:signal transduction histidine kinase